MHGVCGVVGSDVFCLVCAQTCGRVLRARMRSPPALIAVWLECAVGRHTGAGVCVPQIGHASGLLLLFLFSFRVLVGEALGAGAGVAVLPCCAALPDDE